MGPSQIRSPGGQFTGRVHSPGSVWHTMGLFEEFTKKDIEAPKNSDLIALSVATRRHLLRDSNVLLIEKHRCPSVTCPSVLIIKMQGLLPVSGEASVSTASQVTPMLLVYTSHLAGESISFQKDPDRFS